MSRREDAAGEEEIVRAVSPEPGDAPLRAATPRDQRELDLGEAHLRVARGDDEIAAKQKLEAAAEGITVDRRDHRLGICLDRGIHAPAAALEIVEPALVLRGIFLDIGTGHEA